MARTSNDWKRIQHRRATLKTKRCVLEAERDRLLKEDRDLATALEVLQRFGLDVERAAE